MGKDRTATTVETREPRVSLKITEEGASEAAQALRDLAEKAAGDIMRRNVAKELNRPIGLFAGSNSRRCDGSCGLTGGCNHGTKGLWLWRLCHPRYLWMWWRKWSPYDPLVMISWRWLEAAVYRSGFWVRIFGRGVWFATYAGCPEVFSEREGFARVLRIGSWGRVQWLKKKGP